MIKGFSEFFDFLTPSTTISTKSIYSTVLSIREKVAAKQILL